MAAIVTGEVKIPSQVASTLIAAATPGSTVWLIATANTVEVFIGAAGVTPQTGFPLPPGQIIGPLNGVNDIRGVCGEGQGSGCSVRFIQIS